MDPILNEREAEYVNALLKWDRLRIRIGWFFMFLLILGGLMVVVTAILTARKLDDHTVLWMALPAIFVGLLLIVLSVAGIQWLKQRHLIVSILTKLLHKA